MSDDLFATVLRWRGGKGLAKLVNRAVDLQHKPALGFAFDELHYRPEVHYARVRTSDGITRDMRPDEIEACDAFLQTAHNKDRT